MAKIYPFEPTQKRGDRKKQHVPETGKIVPFARPKYRLNWVKLMCSIALLAMCGIFFLGVWKLFELFGS